jgi:hypothetical protein
MDTWWTPDVSSDFLMPYKEEKAGVSISKLSRVAGSMGFGF